MGRCKYDISGFTAELGIPINEAASLYSEFLIELEHDINTLKELAALRDLAEIKIIIHNIKGVSANFRIADVYEHTTVILTSLKSEPLKDIDPLLSALLTISTDAVKVIRRYFIDIGYPI